MRKKLLRLMTFVLSMSLLACAHSRPSSFVVGRLPPDLGKIEILGPDNKVRKANLDEFRGRVLVLEFWASWCSPCLDAFAHLNSLSGKLGDAPVDFLSITDEPADLVRKFLKKNPVGGLVGRTSKQLNGELLGIPALPTSVIVGKDGQVAAITHPAFLQAQHLKRILKGQKIFLPPPMRKEKYLDLTQGPSPSLLVMIRAARPEQQNPTRMGPGILEQFDTPLLELISQAYETSPCRMVASSKLPEGNFDLVIRKPGEKNQKVLRDRMKRAIDEAFGLAVTREKRLMDVLVLSQINSGQVDPVLSDSEGGPSMLMCDDTRIVAKNSPLRHLLNCLERNLGKPIIDETKLKGRYSFEIEMGSSAENNPSVLAVNKSLKEKLGLVLLPNKMDIDVFLISRE